MFERYTEKARRVIFFARYEASQCGAQAIEPPHLLLGLLREDKTLTARFLARAQASVEAIRREVEGRTQGAGAVAGAVFGRGERGAVQQASVELPLAGETKRVLAYAHEESDRLQHRHIGTEHLLLGLLREERSVVGEILSERGLRLAAVREEIARATGADPLVGEVDSPSVLEILTEEVRGHGHRLIELSNRIRHSLSNSPAKFEGIVETVNAKTSIPIEVLNESMPQAVRNAVRHHRHRTVLGVERLLGERAASLRGERIGLVCNQASVDHEWRHVADLFRAHRDVRLTTLFGPQHGIRGTVQDNMVETPHTTDAETELPVYSLYSETREPTEEMLRDVDTIVFDMQDVGCRIYTFIYTMQNCMRAARKFEKRVVVCDRPNPIGGVAMGGDLLERGHESFVGQFPLPTRHGMTTAELAKMFNEEILCELEMIEMEGWSREQWMDDGDAPWVMPSPNIPTLETASVFPGTVHTEGTQLSEGRGTTRPFELTGAPYIEAAEYARELERYNLPGVHFRACSFLPTFQKHAGETCGGVQIHVRNRDEFEPVITGIATIKAARDLYPEKFRWKNPPYEYEHERNPFDVIAGTTSLRSQIEAGDSLDNIAESWREKLAEFAKRREEFLLY